ncbi:hypothetical protein AWB74_03491 [Caballeronia arvi]|uniref:Restriction endonuclease type IV Mrr domain-containing protein n=1 Tax=Caballeronia arvi TaxID=1777135 RepID=A0A158J6Z3_9BURK|nr:restriction endonuclease [Caballeronia arvi]SAL64588.1 hypothetical protein AWB74_03491 [Caballeronia arvi]
MSFPSDIKNAMCDCILKLFWAKDDIVNFFKSNGCNSNDLKSLGNPKDWTRKALVIRMFDHLSQRPDEGLGQFRAMLNSLINWTHFDPFYFDTLGKLNREEARRSIEHLGQLQEIRDHKIHEERRQRELREAESQRGQSALPELKAKFISLLQGEVVGAKRGYALEGILQETCKASSLSVTEPFRTRGEQIDGAVKFDGEHYLIEAKWQDKAAANESVYQFAAKIEGKMYGRGLFVSINGFSENVISSLVAGKAIKTIFIDGADLITVLEGIISLSDMLDRKVKAAQTKGLIYIDAVTGKEKVGRPS